MSRHCVRCNRDLPARGPARGQRIYCPACENQWKLSQPMEDILLAMVSGWGLGSGSSSIFLQKGGVGKGGQVNRVNSSTVWALSRRGLIECKHSFPTSKWRLTPQGRKIAKGLADAAK